MEFTLSAKMRKRILNGDLEILECPKSHIMECEKNNATPEEEDLSAKGYQFPWGQIIEEESDESICWSIRFDRLHEEFLEHGGNATELADATDCCLCDLIERKRIPYYIHQDDGLLDTTSAGIYCNKANKDRARKYLVNRFLNCPGNTCVMEELHDMLNEINLEASTKLHPE
jgi:hypothetical protein